MVRFHRGKKRPGSSLLLIAGLALLAPARAEGPPEGPAPATAPEVPDEYASPRAAVRTFMTTMESLGRDGTDAAAWDRVFDTLALPVAVGNLRRDVAWKLYGVLEGLEVHDLEALAFDRRRVEAEKLTRFELFPQHPEPASREVLRRAVAELGPPPAAIVLEEGPAGRWRFSAETLGNVNRLYGWLEDRIRRSGSDIARFSNSAGLRRLMPAALKNRFVLGLELWQWLGLLAVIFLAVACDFLSRLLLRPLIRRLIRRYVPEPSSRVLATSARPFGLVIGAVAFLILAKLLGLTGMALTVVVVAARLLVIFGGAWAAWSATNVISDALLERARSRPHRLDHMLIPLFRKSIKLFILAIAIIYIADTLSIALAPLLASFGLAGLAVSFAAQDTVRNLFGGLTIFLDRPFKVGDRVIFKSYDGIIEEIGFRSTKLRTFAGHLVTVPNGTITSDAIENPAVRPYIRRILNVTITYDTPREKIVEAVEIIRRLFEEEGLREPIHPRIGKDDLPPRAYFNEFNPDSLNIFVIYWYAPPAWWDYLEHAHRFNLRLFEEFERAGIEFAFPTRTLYLAGDRRRELAVKTLSQDLERSE